MHVNVTCVSSMHEHIFLHSFMHHMHKFWCEDDVKMGSFQHQDFHTSSQFKEVPMQLLPAMVRWIKAHQPPFVFFLRVPLSPKLQLEPFNFFIELI